MTERLRSFGSMLGVAAAAVGVFGALWVGVPAYLDDRIEERINQADFLDRVAARVRPEVIFDEKESVLSDLGAMEYLDTIQVQTWVGAPPPGALEGKSPPGTMRSLKIVVTPRQHLPSSPVLRPFDQNRFVYDVFRGEKFSWVYQVHFYSGFGEGSPFNWPPAQFRLEILRDRPLSQR